MKKGITVCSAVLALSLIMSGCGSKEIKEKEEDLSKIEEKVVKSVASAESFAKEDIEEATTYIEENIENIKDGETAKKLAEYGYYLENAAKKEGIEINHDLAKLGKETSELAEKVYTATEDEKDEIIKNSEKTFKKWGEKLSEEKNTLIDEFHKLINQ